MNALLHHVRISLKLHVRNGMALIYGYAFPTIFLIAFWVLYRYERVPLVRHMGELLTVTVLGGACFGLPTTMVSERERGVWRRIRLAPVSTMSLVASTIAARYVLLVIAGIMQVALAMGIGMPMPRHPLALYLAFSAVAFAFLGLGLVIATLADSVPAVQALGQCIFLPMLIIGGVAVPLASLPDWAQHLSAFFPGRYAVETIQATVNGTGLGATHFSLFALIVIGSAAAFAGARLFRWDAQQRFLARGGKGWLAVSLAAWIGVGVLAETRGRIFVRPADAEPVTAAAVVPAGQEAPTSAPASQPEPTSPMAGPPIPLGPAVSTSPRPPAPSDVPPSTPVSSASRATGGPALPVPQGSGRQAPLAPPPEAGFSSSMSAPAASPASSSTVVDTDEPATWQAVTMKHIDDKLVFNRLPPDGGVVTPIATLDQAIEPDVQADMDNMAAALPGWAPGKVADPVQRVRNYLYVPSVIDVMQLPSEPFVPLVVFEQIQAEIPRDDLIKILYWIALHPDDGDDAAMNDLRSLGVLRAGGDPEEVRGRAGIYAVKLLGQITGKRARK